MGLSLYSGDTVLPAWRAREGFMEGLVREQSFIGEVGFLETNIKGQRESDGQFSAENFQAVEKARAKQWQQKMSNVRAERTLGNRVVQTLHLTGEDTEISKVEICPEFSIGRTKIEPKCHQVRESLQGCSLDTEYSWKSQT